MTNIDMIREKYEHPDKSIMYLLRKANSSGEVNALEAIEYISRLEHALAALSTIEADANATKVGHYFCAQMPCSPSDCTEVPCRYMKDAIANRNNREPEAKPQEPSEDIGKLVKSILDDRYGLSFNQCIDLITAHDDAIRRECAERFTQEWRNAFPKLDDTPPEWTITAILGKEAKK